MASAAPQTTQGYRQRALGVIACRWSLARRWRSPGWTVAFLVGLMLAVWITGVLLALTGVG